MEEKGATRCALILSVLTGGNCTRGGGLGLALGFCVTSLFFLSALEPLPCLFFSGLRPGFIVLGLRELIRGGQITDNVKSSRSARKVLSSETVTGRLRLRLDLAFALDSIFPSSSSSVMLGPRLSRLPQVVFRVRIAFGGCLNDIPPCNGASRRIRLGAVLRSSRFGRLRLDGLVILSRRMGCAPFSALSSMVVLDAVF